MIRYIGILIIIFCSTFSFAQNKNTGRVTDEKGYGVSGATLHVLNTAVSVITNQSGQFSLPDLPKGNYSIEISSIGYARIEKKVQLPQGSDSLIITPYTISKTVGCRGGNC